MRPGIGDRICAVALAAIVPPRRCGPGELERLAALEQHHLAFATRALAVAEQADRPRPRTLRSAGLDHRSRRWRRRCGNQLAPSSTRAVSVVVRARARSPLRMRRNSEGSGGVTSAAPADVSMKPVSTWPATKSGSAEQPRQEAGVGLDRPHLASRRRRRPGARPRRRGSARVRSAWRSSGRRRRPDLPPTATPLSTRTSRSPIMNSSRRPVDGRKPPGGVLGVEPRLDRVAASKAIWSCVSGSGSPAATRSCHSTRSRPVIASVTGCSTCSRVFISMNQIRSARRPSDASAMNSTVPAPT